MLTAELGKEWSRELLRTALLGGVMSNIAHLHHGSPATLSPVVGIAGL